MNYSEKIIESLEDLRRSTLIRRGIDQGETSLVGIPLKRLISGNSIFIRIQKFLTPEERRYFTKDYITEFRIQYKAFADNKEFHNDPETEDEFVHSIVDEIKREYRTVVG